MRTWKELPGENGHWLLGHQPELSRDLVAGLARLKGLGDAVRFRLGPSKAILLSDPAMIQEALVAKAGSFRLAPSLRLAGRRLFGKAIIAGDEPEHSKHRRATAPAVSPARHPSPAAEMARICGEWLAAHRGEAETDAGESMHALALRVSIASMFSRDLPEERTLEISRALRRLIERMRQVSLKPWTEPLMALSPSCRRDRAFLMEEAAKLLEGGSEDRRAGATLKALDPSQWKREEKVLAVLNLLLASSDTTAACLAWTFRLLGLNPGEQDALRAAILQGGEEADAACKRVLKESLRLKPPLWLLGREAMAPLELGDIRLDKGTQIYCSQLLIHRDARWFEDPGAFRPSRWLESPDQPRYAYFPFGYGPRACIGESFAMLQLGAALKAMVPALSFGVEEAKEPELLPFITLQAKGPIRITLKWLESQNRPIA